MIFVNLPSAFSLDFYPELLLIPLQFFLLILTFSCLPFSFSPVFILSFSCFPFNFFSAFSLIFVRFPFNLFPKALPNIRIEKSFFPFPLKKPILAIWKMVMILHRN